MKFGLRLKISAFASGLVILIGFGLLSIAYFHERNVNKESRFVQGSKTLSNTIAFVETPLFRLDIRQMRGIVSIITQNQDLSDIWITGPQGRVITDGTRKNPLRNKALVSPFMTKLIESQSETLAEFDGKLWIGQPITLPDGEILGFAVLTIDGKIINAALKKNLLSQLAVIIPAFLLSIVAATIFAHRITLPLRKLTELTNQIGEGDWSKRVTYSGRDEVGELSKSINIMAGNLSRIAVSRDEMAELAENEAKLKELAESANLAKSNFLSTMSHEIRTPLNGVLGLAQLLGKSDLDADQRKKVDTILSSGQTLLAIINDVLDVSRIEAGHLEMEETAFDPKNLLSTITTPFQNLADEKGLTLNTRVDLGSVGVLKGDPVRLRQIIWNLLSNAIKFTHKGNVTLSMSQIENIRKPKLEIKDHLLHFKIKDTGTGISSDRVSAIFDAFTQEDNSITRRYGGTGLGLSIVKQLTEMKGGLIEVESEVGTGTTFDVYLPYAEASSKETNVLRERTSYSEIENIPPLNVLVAEDNPVNAMIAEAFLQRFGHTVRHVENGKLAVSASQDNWADIVLMDVHMPEMDGIEATKHIRLSKIGETLPIVGVTAEAFAERHAVFIDAGMDGILTKPFTEHQLAEVLARFRGCRGHPSENPGGTPKISIEPNTAKDSASEIVDINTEAEPNRDSPSHHESHPIGDDDKIAALCLSINSETVATLFISAEETLLTRMAELREGIKKSDPGLIHSAAHSIKGATGSMFATRVSALAAEIDQCAEDMEVVSALMPSLENSTEETIKWWRSKSE